MNRFKRSKSLKGITLIHLLVAMAVIGLLSLFTLMVVSTQIKKATDAKRKGDLEEIKIALYDYSFDTGCFPTSLPNCGENFVSDGKVYLNDFPCDPKGNSYGYQVEEGDCSQWFKILASLENTQDQGIDKVGCRNGCGPECNYNYGLASTNVEVYEGCVTTEVAEVPDGETEETEVSNGETFGSPRRRCFIATAVYGTPSALEVEILREFRDEVLLENSLGQELVEFYYQNSPPIAEFISEHPLMKEIVKRVGIDPLVKIIKIY